MKSTFDHIAVIFNPTSTGSAPAKAAELFKRLESSHKKITKLYKTERPKHAAVIAAKIAKKYKRPLIISVSGDGGYHEVINGVLSVGNNHRAACAVEAAGNANDHHREVRDGDIYEKIVQAKTKKIDVLKLTIKNNNEIVTWYAHSYIGLGVTPHIARELNKHKINRLREAQILIRSFNNLRPFSIINSDGKKQKLDSLLFTNIPTMAKVLKVSENSKLHDGLFEVTAFKHSSKSALLGKFLKTAILGWKNNKKVKEYSFMIVKNEPLQLDGELLNLEAGAKVKVESVKNGLETM